MKFLSIWDWYIGLFSSTDDKTVIAAWTASVGTVSFVMTLIILPLYKKIKASNTKVKVEAGISYSLSGFPGMSITTHAPLLTATVTNLSDQTIYIKKPVILLSRPINGENEFQIVIPNTGDKYPYKLEPGSQIVEKYDTSILYGNVISLLSPSDTVAFKVYTTAGKKYTSNTFTQSHIVGHMKVSEEVNRKQNG